MENKENRRRKRRNRMKVPPGKWRIGVAHRKAEVLFFRFANKGKSTIAISEHYQLSKVNWGSLSTPREARVMYHGTLLEWYITLALKRTNLTSPEITFENDFVMYARHFQYGGDVPQMEMYSSLEVHLSWHVTAENQSCYGFGRTEMIM